MYERRKSRRIGGTNEAGDYGLKRGREKERERMRKRERERKRMSKGVKVKER